MKMNKTLILLSVTALALAGCVREKLPADAVPENASDGLVTFNVSLSIPTGEDLSTRAMGDNPDPISNIYIAVFGKNCYLNEFVKAIPLNSSDAPNVDSDGNYVYTKVNGVYNVRFFLKATSSKRYVHVLANVPDRFCPPNFGYMDKVLREDIYCSGDEDGYWQYLELNDGIDNSSATTSRFNNLKLVRNFAKVILDAGSSGYTVEGYEIYNAPDRGCFVPYMGQSLVDDDYVDHYYTGWGTSVPAAYADVLYDAADNSDGYRGYLMPGFSLYHPGYTASDFPTSSTPSAKFCYEHPADDANPVYLIAKLRKDGVSKFYRLDILDSKGRKSALLRNYIYTVTIDNIETAGYASPAEAEANPSDYNFTFSAQTQEIPTINNYGAIMETEYVEKVFTKAQNGVGFKYRYSDGTSYSGGSLSALSTEGEITASWNEGDPGSEDSDHWYNVTYNVRDPNLNSSDEQVSTFSVTAGEGRKLIRRVVELVSMKPRELEVTEWRSDGTGSQVLSFTVPEGLRHSMFPIDFKFLIKDAGNNLQVWSPQDGGLVPETHEESNGTVIYFHKNYRFSDYNAGRKTITIHIKTQETGATSPSVLVTDLDEYFLPLNLGGDFVSSLSARPIAWGTGRTTTFQFVSSIYGNPITLNLTNLTAVSSTTGTLTHISGGTYTYTPTRAGTQSIVLSATTEKSDGTVTLSYTSYSDASITVNRYDKYVTGNLTQGAVLPLGVGQTTTFSFNYSAYDMFPITISAPDVTLSKPAETEGTFVDNLDGTYTYTPTENGVKTFTITSKTNFESAGTISLWVESMTNPASLTVQRATSFTIPQGALQLTGTTNFNAPVYWYTGLVTDRAIDSSNYFNASTNTGAVTIDISYFNIENDDATVYFHYRYKTGLIFRRTHYMDATSTLSALLNATASSPVTLAFSERS